MDENIINQKLIGEIIESSNEIELYLDHFLGSSKMTKAKKLESMKSEISNDIYNKITYIFRIRNEVAHPNSHLYQDEYMKFLRLFKECKAYFILKVEEHKELEEKRILEKIELEKQRRERTLRQREMERKNERYKTQLNNKIRWYKIRASIFITILFIIIFILTSYFIYNFSEFILEKINYIESNYIEVANINGNAVRSFTATLISFLIMLLYFMLLQIIYFIFFIYKIHSSDYLVPYFDYFIDYLFCFREMNFFSISIIVIIVITLFLLPTAVMSLMYTDKFFSGMLIKLFFIRYFTYFILMFLPSIFSNEFTIEEKPALVFVAPFLALISYYFFCFIASLILSIIGLIFF